MSRRKRTYETPEYAAMVGRMITRYGERVAEADPEDLADMLEVRRLLDEAIVTAVRGQVDRGASWARVAQGLGTTREAAFKRFRRRAAASSSAA